RLRPVRTPWASVVPAPGSGADLAVLRDRAFQEEGVDRGVDAVAAAAVGAVALALPGEEDADVLAEFVRHPASALVRGGRVARVADDQDRVRAGRAHLRGV